MKKFLLIIFISTKLLGKEVPVDVENQIRTWINSNYQLEIFGEELQKNVFEDEINSYNWIFNQIKDSKTLNKLQKTYDPKKFGYKILKQMYQIELKKDRDNLDEIEKIRG